jgi:ATP/ADP translocase
MVTSSRLARRLRIQEGEVWPVAVLFLHYFLVSAAVIAGKAARDAFFLSKYDKSILPLMYLANAAAVSLAMVAFSHLSRRLSARASAALCLGFFSGSLFLLEFHLEGWAVPVLYVWMEVIGAVVILQSWMLTGNAFDPRQAKRLFGIIAAGGSIAAWAGGATVSLVASRYGSSFLISVVAVALALSAVTGSYASVFQAPRPKVRAAAAGPASSKRRFSSYVISVAVVIAAASIASAIMQYRFQVAAAQMYPQKELLVAFFGQFYAWSGAASLASQLFLSGFLLSRLGVVAGLFVLPASFSLSSMFVLFSPSLWAAALGRFSDLTFKFTVNNSSMEMLWLPVPPDERQAVKPVISGSLKAVAEAATAILMFLLVRYTPPSMLSLLALVVCGVWMFTILRLRQQYRTALAAVVEKRQLDPEALRLGAQDPIVVQAIDRSLRSPDKTECLAALGFLEGFPVAPWKPTLQSLFNGSDSEIKEVVLHVAGEDSDVFPDRMILDAARSGQPYAALAMQIAASRKLHQAVALLEELLESGEPRIRAQAAAAILKAELGRTSRAADILRSMLGSGRPDQQSEAIRSAAGVPGALPVEQLRSCLDSEAPEVRRAALQALAANKDEASLPSIVRCLSDHRYSLQARLSLRCFPPEAVAAALSAALLQAGSDRKLKAAILRCYRDYPEHLRESELAGAVQAFEFAPYEEFAATLHAVRQRRFLDSAVTAGAKRGLPPIAREAYQAEDLIGALPADRGALLRDFAECRFHQASSIALRISVLDDPLFPIEAALQAVRSADKTRLPYVFELFENSVSREDKVLISPLIDPAQSEQRREVFMERFQENLDQRLVRAACSLEEWESAVTLDYLLKQGRQDLLERVQWRDLRDARLVCEVLARGGAGARLGMAPESTEVFNGMYSTLEKTLFLKSAELFSGISAENLSHLAQIAEDSKWPAGATVFKDGDAGDALYLVAAGKIRITKNDTEIALLERGACFGEMAVLDPAPRSANAIVAEDATLLRIDADDFFDVLSENPQIVQGILKLLTRRLREANARLAHT